MATDNFKAAYSSTGWYVECKFGEVGVAFCNHGGYLDPKSRFQTEQEAQKAARLCNLAFDEGVRLAQRNMRKALGIDTE